ncbi:stage V sporulation protein AC [Clostridia bacterium]|nr:stage V sporulation protein AC [Clostridia bacterium]
MITPEKYKTISKQVTPKTDLPGTLTRAFIVGGAVCVIGEFLRNLYANIADEETAYFLVSATLILTAAMLTVVGLFHKLAGFAGAGVLVPVTGFANSIASAAVEYKTEGYILGVGSKIFAIAGPVILYGITSAAIYGVIYNIVTANV